MQFVDTLKFELTNGEIVELSVTQEFLEKIKQEFSLSSTKEINERHVKNFLVGSMRNALEQVDGNQESDQGIC